METLTSLKNPRIQLWRSLKDTGVRRETGLFLVEGRKTLEEALSSGFRVEAVLLDESRADAFAVPDGIPCYALPPHVLAAVCDTKTPQGCAAVLAVPETQLTGSRLVVLDDVQDPGNVGTIIRTADAAGLDGVLMSSHSADPYSPKVLRATMGSVFHLPIQVTGDLPSALSAWKEKGFGIISSQLDGTPFRAACASVGPRFCLIIGNEGNGVSEAVRALATHHVRLPMRGRAESLNAAVAAGIMMYGLMDAAED